MKKTILMLLLCACDPAGQYVGTWVGQETVTFIINGRSSTSPATAAQQVLTENPATGDINFNECGLTGTPSAGNELLIHASTCAIPPDSNGCSGTMVINNGGAMIRGGAYSMNYEGLIFFRCTDGSSGDGNYSVQFNAGGHQ